jgi:hypothetical protein
VLPDGDELVDWLKGRLWLVALGLGLAAFGVHYWLTGPLDPPPGVLVTEDPVQGPPTRTESWTHGSDSLTSLASFDIQARVLARERYRFDRAADLSPIDLALGWGRMSDSAVLDQLKIWQDGRWYYWSTRQFPIPAEEITSHSANMHMIPATPLVKRQLLRLRVGQVVRIRGQLIKAQGGDGWHWASSLSRADSGDGACEVIWVESVEAR